MMTASERAAAALREERAWLRQHPRSLVTVARLAQISEELSQLEEQSDFQYLVEAVVDRTRLSAGEAERFLMVGDGDYYQQAQYILGGDHPVWKRMERSGE